LDQPLLQLILKQFMQEQLQRQIFFCSRFFWSCTRYINSRELLLLASDVAGSTTVVNGGTGYVNVLARDAMHQTLATSGVLQATATGGAVVAWDGAPTTQVSFAAKDWYWWSSLCKAGYC
jgi:hypothetical protein